MANDARHAGVRALTALAVAVGLGAAAPARAADGVVLFAAGSLRDALTEAASAFTSRTGVPVTTAFGPSGLMRGRIERGERADVFASANLGHPRRLVAEGRAETVVPFARNRLCALARPEVGLTTTNFLDRALDPAVQLAASTPGVDPSGDYASEAFAIAEGLRPGAERALRAKVLRFVDGLATPLAPGRNPVLDPLVRGEADVFLAYCTYHRTVRDAGAALDVVELPEDLAVGAVYGVTVIKGAPPDAHRLALFLLSEEGQAILTEHGFITTAGK